MAWICACGQENADGARFCNQCGAPYAEVPIAAVAPGPSSEAIASRSPEPAPPARLTPSQQGPAPSEGTIPVAPPAKGSKALLIVVVIIAVVLVGTCVLGIVAAIAVPNFIAAKDRAQQKRALADLQSISAACQSFKADTGSYPATGHSGDTYYSISDASALEPFLVPKYAPSLPERDPWSHPYSYGVSQDASEFVLICTGSDGENKLEAIPETPVTTSCYEDEIVLENGAFIQKPEGQQKHCK